MDSCSLPFTVRVLGASPSPGFAGLLPASHRTTSDQVVTPQPDLEFLEGELLIKRINAVQDWLWVCGRPMPPRPLHHQALMSRNIAITETAELHLVWSKDRIFLKPVPLYLLDPDFWKAYIVPLGNQDDARRRELTAAARGFMFSYCALISYESDHRLALASGLLPLQMTWENWKELSHQILEHHSYASVNPRYWYGELRLSRLNKIYRFRKGFIFRGYSRIAAHTVYADLLRDNFAALATILGYVVIVLSAMQVGLGTEKLASNEMFQNVSYGFTVFSLIAPLGAVAAIVLFVFLMFITNWMATKSYEGKRFDEMGVEPFWRQHSPRYTPVPSSGKGSTPQSIESATP